MTSQQQCAVFAVVMALLSISSAVAGLELGRYGGAVLAIGGLYFMTRATAAVRTPDSRTPPA